MKSLTKCLIILVVFAATIEAGEYWRTGSDGRQYFINSDENSNWYQALHKCARQNQQLVEIHSEEKNNVLLEILREFTSLPNLWVGLNDEENEVIDFARPFYWAVSGKRMTFSYWHALSPDNAAGKEHCVHMWTGKSIYEWNDNKCTVPLGFICEDNHVSIEKCQELEAKRKEIVDISTNVSANNQQRHKQQTENLEKGFKCLQRLENQLGGELLEMQTKLEEDIKQLMMENVNATVIALHKRNKLIHNLGVEVQKSADMSDTEFSEKLQSSQENIDNILQC